MGAVRRYGLLISLAGATLFALQFSSLSGCSGGDEGDVGAGGGGGGGTSEQEPAEAAADDISSTVTVVNNALKAALDTTEEGDAGGLVVSGAKGQESEVDETANCAQGGTGTAVGTITETDDLTGTFDLTVTTDGCVVAAGTMNVSADDPLEINGTYTKDDDGDGERDEDDAGNTIFTVEVTISSGSLTIDDGDDSTDDCTLDATGLGIGGTFSGSTRTATLTGEASFECSGSTIACTFDGNDSSDTATIEASCS